MREVMETKMDFVCGVWCACIYRSATRDLIAYIYGDNFVLKGSRKNNLQFFEDLKQHM